MDTNDIAELLIYLGIMPNKQGFGYMESVLKVLFENERMTLRQAYEQISAASGANICTIDSCIRNAIHSAYTNEKLLRLNDIFGFEVIDRLYCPTNHELISLIARHFKTMHIKDDRYHSGKDRKDIA